MKSRIAQNAIGQRKIAQNRSHAPPRWARRAIASPSGPPKTITLGKNASSELNATCCPRPRQSSAMNCFAVRLKTSSHSRAESLCGPGGTCPTSGPASAAVDKREASGLRLRLALAAAAREQSHRRADPAGEEEAGTRRAGCEHGELGAHHRAHVRGGTQLVDRVCELLPLALDLAADVVGYAPVRSGHHSLLNAVEVTFASWIACSGTGGVPLRIIDSPISPSAPARTNSATVTISSASQVAITVARAAAIVAKRKPSA